MSFTTTNRRYGLGFALVVGLAAASADLAEAQTTMPTPTTPPILLPGRLRTTLPNRAPIPLLNNGSLLTTPNPNAGLPNQLPYLYIASMSEDWRLHNNGLPLPGSRLAMANEGGGGGGGGGTTGGGAGGAMASPGMTAAPGTTAAPAPLAPVYPPGIIPPYTGGPGVNIFPPTVLGAGFSRGPTPAFVNNYGFGGMPTFGGFGGFGMPAAPLANPMPSLNAAAQMPAPSASVPSMEPFSGFDSVSAKTADPPAKDDPKAKEDKEKP